MLNQKSTYERIMIMETGDRSSYPDFPHPGHGHPRNLKRDDILIEARILALADVVASMASYRPYRPAKSINAALEEIEENKGTLYDVEVVDVCLRLFREKGYHFS